MKKSYLVITLTLFGLTVLGQPGQLDPSFGTTGYVRPDFGSTTGVSIPLRDILFAPDGRFYIIYGTASQSYVSRRLPDGSLDLSYGRSGYSIPLPISSASGALQGDQKLVLGGTFTYGNEDRDFGLVRLNTNGYPDSSFTGDGVTITDFNYGNDEGRHVLIQPDGKILLGGLTNTKKIFQYPQDDNDFALARYLPDGSPDASFSEDGKQVTDISGTPDEGQTLALAPDGKIILGGKTYHTYYPYFALVRYHPDGSLDMSFSSDGKYVNQMFTKVDPRNSVAVQADGKIILGGYVYNELGADFALFRLTQQGLADNSFSGDGMVVTDFFGSDNDLVHVVGVQQDGKILAGGITEWQNKRQLGVVRYLSDGTLDNNFSGDGIQVTELGNTLVNVFSMAILNDGRLLFGSNSYQDGRDVFSIVRYLPNGETDASLNSTGKIMDYWHGGNSFFNAVAVQPDGKVIVGGRSIIPNKSLLALARYAPNGTPDNSFSGDGKSLIDLGTASGEIMAIALQPDGKIVLAGTISGGSPQPGNLSDFFVIRLNPDGSMDPGFSGDGIQTTDFSSGRDGALSLVIQPDGKILLAGFNESGNNIYVALARYLPDGSPDLTFSGDGKLTASYGAAYNWAFSVALQPDGRIVAGGYSYFTGTTPFNQDFGVMRFHPDGTLDQSFDHDGILLTDLSAWDEIFSLVIQSDGKILAAGRSGTDAVSDFSLVRYNSDGSLDPGFSQDGKLILDLGSRLEEIRSLALQSDGKILAGGIIKRADKDMILLRFNSDGSLDHSFGSIGRRITDLGFSDEEINEIALQNGRIYAAGVYNTGPNEGLLAAFLNGAASPVMIPAKIEAENWSGMHGVQTEATSDAGGGLNVGYIDYTDWIDYYIDVPVAGKYQVHFRLATTNNNAQFNVTRGDELLSIVHVPQTGSYQSWITHTINLDLAAGPQTLTLTSTNGGAWNVNWIEFANPPVPVYTDIPALIEAEDWDAMNGVRTEPSTDVAGGINVGYIDYLDYLSYNLHVPVSGTYQVSFRLATPSSSNPRFELRNAAGTILAEINVPNTGGFQNWTTVTLPIWLTAGNETYSVVSTGGGFWNINWIRFDHAEMPTDVYARIKTNAEIPNGPAISVYPNPTSNVFKLNAGLLRNQKLTIRVLNISGQTIEQLEVTDNRSLEFGGSYKPGVYFMECTDGRNRTLTKLLKW